MSWNVVLSERAQKELIGSWSWYEDRQTGLGDRFKETIYKKLEQIEKNYDTGPRRTPVYREAIVKVFPYVIIYRVLMEERQIFVHSIFHTRRNPQKKYR